jgi:predicted protein tyrosine phosphatase
VGVILVVQRGGDAKVTKEDGTIVVNKEVCCFDIPMNKAIYMQITINRDGVEG